MHPTVDSMHRNAEKLRYLPFANYRPKPGDPFSPALERVFPAFSLANLIMVRHRPAGVRPLLSLDNRYCSRLWRTGARSASGRLRGFNPAVHVAKDVIKPFRAPIYVGASIMSGGIKQRLVLRGGCVFSVR